MRGHWFLAVRTDCRFFSVQRPNGRLAEGRQARASSEPTSLRRDPGVAELDAVSTQGRVVVDLLFLSLLLLFFNFRGRGGRGPAGGGLGGGGGILHARVVSVHVCGAKKWYY